MPLKTVPETDDSTILLLDRASQAAIPHNWRYRLLQKTRPQYGDTLRNLFILCAASELAQVSELVSAVNRRHQLRALFIRQDAEADWIPQLFERANMRVLRNTLVHSDLAVPKRVLTAWKHRAEKQLIANATVVDDRLLIMSCEPETIEVRFEVLPSLRAIPRAERKNFVISDDGSYIHWPTADIHLDIDGLRSALDPLWADKCAVKRVAHDSKFGNAISDLRRISGIRQSDITGLSERQVRRIEAGEPASVSALRALADAHGMTLDDYLTAVSSMLLDSTPKRPLEHVGN